METRKYKTTLLSSQSKNLIEDVKKNIKKCFHPWFRMSRGTSMAEEEVDGGRKTTLAQGPNPANRRGPNDDLLL